MGQSKETHLLTLGTHVQLKSTASVYIDKRLHVCKKNPPNQKHPHRVFTFKKNRTSSNAESHSLSPEKVYMNLSCM